MMRGLFIELLNIQELVAKVGYQVIYKSDDLYHQPKKHFLDYMSHNSYYIYLSNNK